MSVLEVRENWKEAAAGGSGDKRTASRGFTVLCSSANDGPLVAQTAVGIPRYGDRHPRDQWLRAERPQVKTVTPLYFAITVEYVSNAGSSSTSNPLHEAAKIHWGSEVSVEPVDVLPDDGRTNGGKPIVNYAGVGFNPPFEREFYDSVLTISRNEASYNEAQAILYRGAINSDAFFGAAKGQAKCTDIQAERIVAGTLIYWAKSYQFKIRRDGWWSKRCQVGLMERVSYVAGFSFLQTITNPKTREPVTEPVRLNPDGTADLTSDLPPDLRMIEFPRSLPFSALRLP